MNKSILQSRYIFYLDLAIRETNKKLKEEYARIARTIYLKNKRYSLKILYYKYHFGRYP